MRKLEKDRAFFVPELEILLENGTKAMEIADSVSSGLAQSAIAVSSSISRLPRAARFSQAKASAGRLAEIAPKDEYLECRDMMQNNITRIINDVLKYDMEAAEKLDNLQAELKLKSGEVTNFRLLLRDDISSINPMVFGMKLANINMSDKELQVLIAEYVSLEKGVSELTVDWEKVWEHQQNNQLSSQDATKFIDWLWGKGKNPEIEWMKSLGYTTQGIVDFGNVLETQEDRQFWLNLIKRDYENLYKINPNNLSPLVMHQMYSYTCNLVSDNQMKELQKLINGMLTSNEMHSFYDHSAYGLAYLEILHTISDSLFESESDFLIISYGVISSDEWDSYYDKMILDRDMSLLWKSLYCMFEPENYWSTGIEVKSLELLYGYQLTELKRADYGFKFGIQYNIAHIGEPKSPAAGDNIREIEVLENALLTVRTYYGNTTEGISNIQSRNQIQKLEKKRDDLFGKYFVDTTIAVVAVYYPVLGIILNLGNALISGATVKSTTQSAKGVEKGANFLADNEVISKEIANILGIPLQTAGILVSNYFEYHQKYDEVTKEMDAVSKQRRLEWFGFAAGYQTGDDGKLAVGYCTDGLNNVDRRIALKEWEKQGLGFILEGEIDLDHLEMSMDEVIRGIEEWLIEDGLYTGTEETIHNILYGGDLYNLDIMEFTNDIIFVDMAIEKVTDKDVKIKNTFEKKKVK